MTNCWLSHQGASGGDGECGDDGGGAHESRGDDGEPRYSKSTALWVDPCSLLLSRLCQS